MTLKAQQSLRPRGKGGRQFDAGPLLPRRAERACGSPSLLEPKELLLAYLDDVYFLAQPAAPASFLIGCLRLCGLCLHPPEPWQDAGLERFWPGASWRISCWRRSCVCRIACLQGGLRPAGPPCARCARRLFPVCRSSARRPRMLFARLPTLEEASWLLWLFCCTLWCDRLLPPARQCSLLPMTSLLGTVQAGPFPSQALVASTAWWSWSAFCGRRRPHCVLGVLGR